MRQAERNGRPERSLQSLVEETVHALENMDADSLAGILARAETLRDANGTLAVGALSAAPARDILRELLKATERNLSLLRRLREKHELGGGAWRR